MTPNHIKDDEPKDKPVAKPEVQIPEIIDTPISINEPPGSEPFPPAEEPAKSEPKPGPEAPPHKAAHHGHSEHGDPDDLEEELDEAIEEGDAEVSHKNKPKPKGKR